MNKKNFDIVQRFLREPLLHFIAIGGLFFLVYSAFNNFKGNAPDTIFITPERIDQVKIEFKGVWNRIPTDEELNNLIEEEIRSEVYYRDALALGLDKNDAVVRRRLRQKMEFLTDTSIYLKEPSPEELVAYFAENEQAYRKEPLLAFEQIYLGKSPPEEGVAQILKRLLLEPAMDTSTLRQHTFLPVQLKLLQPDAIDSVFGKGFYNQINDFPPGDWNGPAMSVYGTHLIRTLDERPARMPPLDEVRSSVLRDWKSAKAKENSEQEYKKRRSRYIVEILPRKNTDEVVR